MRIDTITVKVDDRDVPHGSARAQACGCDGDRAAGKQTVRSHPSTVGKCPGRAVLVGLANELAAWT
jgi:hypothetical protein